jgi:hypothetical protein
MERVRAQHQPKIKYQEVSPKKISCNHNSIVGKKYVFERLPTLENKIKAKTRLCLSGRRNGVLWIRVNRIGKNMDALAERVNAFHILQTMEGTFKI